MAYDVPEEFANEGLATPEEAADWISDVIGYQSIQVMQDRAAKAARLGRAGEQAFYEEVRDILIEGYAEWDREAERQDPDDPRYARPPDEDDQT